MADDGTLFVLSDPIPFRIETGIAPCAGFELPEMQGANALSTRLGDTIEDAVDAASEQLIDDGDAANLVFVDWRTGDRVDDGYTTPTGEELDYIDSENGICSGEPYMNGFDRATLFSGDLSNNFHPCRRRLRVRAARRGDGGPARRLRRLTRAWSPATVRGCDGRRGSPWAAS
jgi:hypothetical protein